MRLFCFSSTQLSFCPYLLVILALLLYLLSLCFASSLTTLIMIPSRKNPIRLVHMELTFHLQPAAQRAYIFNKATYIQYGNVSVDKLLSPLAGHLYQNRALHCASHEYRCHPSFRFPLLCLVCIRE